MPEWHEKLRMNTGMIDGSARSMAYDECVNDLATPIRPPSVANGQFVKIRQVKTIKH